MSNIRQHMSKATVLRFPLVARPRPICRPVPTRLAQIRSRADQTSQGGQEALLRAAESLNLTALLASDCGQSDLARDLCRRQFEIFSTARPLRASAAQLALQPLINLARLLSREGDGQARFQALDALLTALKTEGSAEINSVTFDLRSFVAKADDLHGVCRWLREVVLSDGVRALARAGQWDRAVTYAETHGAIGPCLREGRQIAVVSNCMAGEPSAGLALLRNSLLTEQWEHAVSSCLAVLCLRIDGQPTGFAAQQMITEYLAVEHDPALVMFNTHLGLTVLDLLPDGDDPAPVIDRLMSTVTGVGGANGARESLAHPRFLNGLSSGQAAELVEIVESSTLAQSILSSKSRIRLLTSVKISEVAAMRQLEIARLGAMQTP